MKEVCLLLLFLLIEQQTVFCLENGAEIATDISNLLDLAKAWNEHHDARQRCFGLVLEGDRLESGGYNYKTQLFQNHFSIYQSGSYVRYILLVKYVESFRIDQMK